MQLSVTVKSGRICDSKCVLKPLDTFAQMLRKNTDKILATSALAGISVFQWLVSLFLSMYLLAEKEQLKNGFLRLMRALLSDQQFETVTRFLHRYNSMSSLWVLIGVISGRRMIGVAGAILAIPAVAIFDYLYRDYLLPHVEEKKRQREILTPWKCGKVLVICFCLKNNTGGLLSEKRYKHGTFLAPARH